MRWLELLPLVLIALIFFGPKRLPEMGSSIGKTIREFQKSIREVTGGVEEALKAPEQPAAASTLPPVAPVASTLPAQETAAATTSAEPVSANAVQPDADS